MKSKKKRASAEEKEVSFVEGTGKNPKLPAKSLTPKAKMMKK